MSDPELLTRLFQQTGYLPDKSDYLAEGKKVVPNSTFSVQSSFGLQEASCP
jgi:hypothetical protein